jgi:lysophospholipase L1-like esterase
VLIYSGFEAYFRYRFDQSDSLGFLDVSSRWYGRHVVYNNFQYRDDKDYSVAKTPGVVRIGVMGDSNTFGYGIKNVDNRFSNLLEAKLNKAGYKVQVYNFGVPGFDTWNEISNYYSKDQKFKPDILVWQYFLNDAEATQSAGTKVLTGIGDTPPLVHFLSQHSFFFDYLYWRLAIKYNSAYTALGNADMQQYSIPSVFNFHKQIIGSFVNDLKSRNTKIVVTVLPFFQFFPYYPAEEIHDKMDRLFKRDNVDALVDMLPYVAGKKSKDLVVDPYDSHPNEYVHNLIAEKLYNAIVPLLTKTDKGTFVKDQ